MKKYFYKPTNVVLEIHENEKYTDWNGQYKEIRYSDVEAFEVVSGVAAEKIEAESDGSCIDEYHEYLVLYFSNGDTATFRNSHVDLFKDYGRA